MERAFGFSKDCFVVRGHLQSAIYDTRRQFYSVINNSYADQLQEYVGKSETNVRERLHPEFLQFLLNNEFGYFWPANLLEQFTDISLAYDHPSSLGNAIIEGAELPAFDSINLLLKAGCRHFLLIMHNTASLDELEQYLSAARFAFVPTLELHFHKLEKFSIHQLKTLVKKFTFIASLNIYNEKREHFFIINQIPIAITKRAFPTMTPVMSPDIFFVNLPLFIESNSHNPYFHRKIYIGINGEIRNTPEDSRIFGNVNDLKSEQEITAILSGQEFQHYWHITKGQVDVCRHCEFRYMCVDARLPVQRTDGSWYYAEECAYNPYLAKWKWEEDYRPLLATGVQCNQDGFTLDDEVLETVRKEVWEDIY